MQTRRLFVCAFLFLVCLISSSAFSQELSPVTSLLSPVTPNPVQFPAFETQSNEFLNSQFFPTLGYDLTQGLFTSDSLYPFLIGSAATLAVLPFDHKISNSMTGDFHAFGEAGQFLGGPATVYPLVGGALLAMPFTKNEKFRAFSLSLTRALIIDEIMVGSLKVSVGRTRPDGSDTLSFPSGHSSNTFAIATVLNHYYGKKWGIPAYILSGLVAASRIEKGKHYASDVIFGATLGILAGRSAVRDRFMQPKTGVFIAPYVGLKSAGLNMTIRF